MTNIEDDEDNQGLDKADLDTLDPYLEDDSNQVESPPTNQLDPNSVPAAQQDYGPEIGKEVDKAEAMQQAAALPLPPITQKDRAVRHAQSYQDMLQQYKDLQDQQRQKNMALGFLASGQQIGQGITGKYTGQFKPDLTNIEMLQKQAAQPTEAFEKAQGLEKLGVALQGQEQALDPSSPMSAAARAYAKDRLKLDLPEDTSFFDIQQLLKSAGKPTQTKFQQLPMVNQKTGDKIMGTYNPTTNTFQDTAGNLLDSREWVRDYRAQSFLDPKSQERLSFNAGTGKISGKLTGPGVNAPVVPEPGQDLTGEQPIQINRSFLNNQQAKQVDHARDKFIQEVKDDRNSLNANDRVIQVLQAGGQLGDLPREIQDQLNRSFGQKGHISDAQLGGLLGKADWKDRVQNAVSLGLTGKLTDENRQFLLDVANLIKQQNQSYIDKKSQIYTQNLYSDLKSSPNLQKYKFGPDSVKSLLGVEAAVNPGGSSPARQLKEKQSGRIVPIKADQYDAALKSGLFEKVQ